MTQPLQLEDLIPRALQDALTPDIVADLQPVLAADLLSYFAASGEGVVVERLVDLGTPIDGLTSRGTNALIVAIAIGDLEMTRLLLELGADRETETRDGTPAEFALNVGSREMARLVSERILPTDEDLLRLYARSDDVEEMSLLLEAGVAVDAADEEGVTPLIEATVAGAVGSIELLLATGADPHVVTADGNTSMGAAVASGNGEVVRLLLAAGARADGEVRGVPHLTLAVISGNDEIIDLLLLAGANRERMDNDGVRPAAIARVLGYDDVADKLGGTPELEARPDLPSLASRAHRDAFKEALEQGADPNQVNAEGVPVAMLVAADGSSDMIRKLHTAGGNLRVHGPGGNNVLHAALTNTDRLHRKNILLELLQVIDEGIEELLSQPNDAGRSAFTAMAATLVGQEGALISSHLRPESVRNLANKPDPDGITPLMAAVLTDNGPFVAQLIERGAVAEVSAETESLQDLARAQAAWSALAALPDDRPIPWGLMKGADTDTKKEMQGLLAKWGYYTGELDGVFGPGSRAAMTAFLKDRERELINMAPHFWRITTSDVNGNGNFALMFTGETCTWWANRWPDAVFKTRLIGCFAEDEYMRKGFAYIEHAGGKEDLYLFGDDRSELVEFR